MTLQLTQKDAPLGWDICPLEQVLELEKKQVKKEVNLLDELLCQDCHVEMVKSWNDYSLVCPECQVVVPTGQTGEHHTIGAGENHNTSNNAYMCFKPVGTKNRLYYNTMIKYTSEYEPYRDAQIMALLKQYNFINQDFKIPQDVLKNACEMFIVLKEYNYVRRGKSRRGVLGACIYVQCQIANITKTKSQISKLMQVEESKITFGLEELQQYAKLGVIEIPQNVDPTKDYINIYFEIFELPEEWKDFVIELIERMSIKKIEEVEKCYNTTKCIGTVYFLSKALKRPLTHEQIALNCDNISRGTYLNVSQAIIRNPDKLKKVFKKHKFPMPVEWNDEKKKKKQEQKEEQKDEKAKFKN